MTAGPSSEPLFELDHATVRYGSVTVLDAVSIRVQQGETVAVVGPNGSGKSTLLRVLSGLVEPNSGVATLRGAPLSRLTPRERAQQIAYVPQDTTIPFEFSVRDIVAMGRSPYLSPWGFESGEDLAAIEEAIGVMDLAAFAHRSILEVSGGERQRAVIARALAQKPAVLLLDEPGTNLDLRYQIALHALLARLNMTAGLTIVFVSHDLNAVASFHRIVALVDGRVRAMGPPDRVLTEAMIRDTFGCRALVDSHPQSERPRVTIDWSAP